MTPNQKLIQDWRERALTAERERDAALAREVERDRLREWLIQTIDMAARWVDDDPFRKNLVDHWRSRLLLLDTEVDDDYPCKPDIFEATYERADDDQ